jgi:type VI secretion system VasD/TssJ family lipoprotein
VNENRYPLLILSLTFLFLAGCGGGDKPSPTQAAWPYGANFTYKENAIRVHVNADPQLNRYNGNPRTLHVCIYQLRTPNDLNQVAFNRDGLYQLLDRECGYSAGSVAGSRALTVHPGEENTYIYDRMEGAKFLAFVAGYFSLEKERILKMERIPVVLKEEKEGMFSTRQVATVPDMNVDIQFGAEQIQRISVKP